MKVTIGEAMEGVLATGCNTKLTHFRGVVNNMLPAGKRHRKVARGESALKE